MWTGQLDEAIEHLERAQAVATEAGVEVDRVRRERAPRAGQRAARRLRARPAPRPPGACRRRASWLGPIGAPAPRTACSLPSASSASWTRPNASSATAARRCATPASGRCGLPRPQSRAAVERPRDRAGALDLLHATREQVGDWPLPGPVRRAPDRRGGPLGRGGGSLTAAARALLTPASAGSPAVANALARLYLLDEEAEAARATLAAHLDALDARHGASLPTRAEALLTRSPWTPSPSTRPPRSRWNALSTWPSRQGYAGFRGARRPDQRTPRRHIRHGTTHPALVGDLLETIERGGRPATVAAARLWPSC